MFKKILLVVGVIFYSFESAYALDNFQKDEEQKQEWLKPDYIKMQYAGNIGFLAIGAGYGWWNEIVQTDFLYGFVPESKGNAKIHTFTFKNTFSLYKFVIFEKYKVNPILGFSLSLEPGQNSFARIPEKYPDGYYFPNNFYVCLNAGAKSKFSLKDERYFSFIEAYIEVNTLAYYSFCNIIAKGERSNKIYSLGLGVNMFF